LFAALTDWAAGRADGDALAAEARRLARLAIDRRLCCSTEVES
jgi:hypothetical protein